MWRLIIGALVIAPPIYALACAVTPFARCRRCDGNGKYRKRTAAPGTPANAASGAGHRLRWGRQSPTTCTAPATTPRAPASSATGSPDGGPDDLPHPPAPPRRGLRRIALLAVAGLIVAIIAARHTDQAAGHAGDRAMRRPRCAPSTGCACCRPGRTGPATSAAAARGQACSFGPAWTDNTTAPGGHNGCDTRDDVLRAQLADVRYRPGSRCVVIAGVLHDPYTGRTIRFAKAHAAAVQIDHIVPLALAWDLGANTWPQAQRSAFANDEQPGPARRRRPRQRSQSATPVPPTGCHPTGRAGYAQRFIAVLAHYRLPVVAADKTALTHALKETAR